MYCPNCGKESPDGSVFCQECGEKFESSAPEVPEEIAAETAQTEYKEPAQPEPQAPVQPQNQGSFQPQYQPVPAPGYTPYRAPAAGNTVLATIRRLFSSPLFLVATIFMTLGTVVSAVSAILTKPEVYVNTGSNIYRITTGRLNSSVIIGALVAMTPAILIIAGLWITYATAKKQDDAPFTTAGLTMIKVIAIISMVFLGIGAVLLMIGLLFFVLRGGAFYDAFISELNKYGYGSLDEILGELPGARNYGFDYRSITAAVMIVALVILVIVFALAFIYLAKLVKSVNTVKRSATTYVPSDRVSTFVAVMMYIFGILGTIGAISMMVNGAPLLGAASLLSSVASIMFGAFIFKYRAAMKEEMAKCPQGAYQPYGQYQPQYNNGYFEQRVTGVTCPRCGGAYASNLAVCPHCGLPRQNF